MQKDKKKNKFSRRDFIKTSTIAGAGAVIAGYSSKKNPIKAGTAHAASFYTKEHEEFPLEMNEDFERFNNRDVIFMRGISGDEKDVAEIAKKVNDDESGFVPPSGNPGFTEIESALFVASWSVNNECAHLSQFGLADSGLYSWEGNEFCEVNTEDRRTHFSSPEEASMYIKKTANFFKADMCGIAPYDERWTYTSYFDAREGISKTIDLPFKPKYTIVLAHEMDYEAYKCAPTLITGAATGTMYSQMAVRTHQVTTFIRRLGYNAIGCGNDTGLSIPVAISAGLGELSRMGMLVTPKYGPRVRLTKIFTDLELQPDKPITFGVEEFCKVCMKCADNCPSDAVCKDDEPSYKLYNKSNIKGVKKWSTDAEKCFKYWAESGSDCGACISVCPYNKIEEWHHDLAKLATVAPGVRNVARQLDELFGYGKLFNEDAYEEFWQYNEDK